MDERQVIVTRSQAGIELQQRTSCLAPKPREGSDLAVATIIRLNAKISALRDALAKNSAAAG